MILIFNICHHSKYYWQHLAPSVSTVVGLYSNGDRDPDRVQALRIHDLATRCTFFARLLTWVLFPWDASNDKLSLTMCLHHLFQRMSILIGCHLEKCFHCFSSQSFYPNPFNAFDNFYHLRLYGWSRSICPFL